MCNPLRAIKKVFKKAVKVVKKVAPVALAAAAIYFTVGAALGVPGTAGGWGGAASGLVGKLGLGSTLTSVVTGAVTQAGYGAVLGGGLSLASGGDVNKGLLTGAGLGAATGSISGALGVPSDPFGGIGEAPTTAASSGVTGTAPASPGAATGSPTNLVPSQGPLGVPVAGGGGAAAVGGAGGDALSGVKPFTGHIPGTNDGLGPSRGLLSNVGGFVEKNPTLVGGAIAGLGAGISGFAQADAEIEAAEVAAQERQDERDQIASNFGVGGGGGLLTSANLDTTRRPAPTQRFVSAGSGGRWFYNPQTGQVEMTPIAGA